MKLPFFSIVIPTYNRAGFLGVALRSVLEQQYHHWEVLVVDDGSTDNTAQVVADLADLRIHYLPQENRERGAARNHGLARAQGQYVVFLDSDDELLPHHLAVLHAHIAQVGQPDFIATRYNFNRYGVIAPGSLATVAAGWHGLDLFLDGNVLACNVCVRRANPGLRPFQEDRRYAAVEDWLFMLENTQHAQVYIVDATTLTMHDHDERSMRADNAALVRKLQLALTWMLAHLTLTPTQQARLTGRVYYLCAIHSYADGHRGGAISFARRAALLLPKSQALTLLVRCMVGLRVVNWVKKLRA